jgi:hypothetical protein
MTKAEIYKESNERQLNVQNFDRFVLDLIVTNDFKNKENFQFKFPVYVKCDIDQIQIDLFFKDESELKIVKTTEGISYKS